MLFGYLNLFIKEGIDKIRKDGYRDRVPKLKLIQKSVCKCQIASQKADNPSGSHISQIQQIFKYFTELDNRWQSI